MPASAIPTETLKFTDARPQLSGLLDRVFRRETRIVIRKGTIPVAALVSLDDLDRLLRLDATRAAELAILDEIGHAFADQTPAEIARATAEAVEAARATARIEPEAALPR
jgi:prevent-host-death family protein